VNDRGKPQNDPAQPDERARELVEQLNLLEAVDQRVTPEHVAQRFQELLKNADPSTPADVEQQALRESGIRRAGRWHRRLPRVPRRIPVLAAFTERRSVLAKARAGAGQPGAPGIGWVTRFLIWLSGANLRIAAECPGERPKYTGLGAAVLISAAMAGVSLAFALGTVLNAGWGIALPFAFAWGASILLLNRLFVVSLPRKPRASLIAVIPRLLLAVLVGLTISTPIVLQVFRPEIQQEITVLHDQAVAVYDAQLHTGPAAKQIQAEQAEVTALRAAISNGGTPGSSVRDPALQNLIKERGQAQTDAQMQYAKWQCQLYGTGPGGERCPVGSGELADDALRAYQNDEAVIADYNAQIKTLEQADLSSAMRKLQADQISLQQQADSFNLADQGNTGLLISLQALDKVAAGNSNLETARWILLVLFVLIDCMPVAIKVMLNFSPESAYDRMLEAEEKMQLQVAAEEREVRLAAHMKAAEARSAAEQDRLAGLSASRPDVTPETVAARRRVEAEMLKAWESDQTRNLVGEARKLGIPVVAILDYGDPNEVSFQVPGNEDAICGVALLTRVERRTAGG